jgi:hypothetical protein
MRVLIATDAWHPQVNGVVRTLTSLQRSALKLGVAIDFLTPEGFPSIQVPTYPGLRLALPSPTRIARRIEQASPDAIDIATEGPIGHMVRRFCVNRRLPFTTSYATRFPEYISARLSVPDAWSYAVLRWFHSVDEDLRAACLGALQMSREACRNFALSRSWERSARQFIGHINQVVIGDARKPRAA